MADLNCGEKLWAHHCHSSAVSGGEEGCQNDSMGEEARRAGGPRFCFLFMAEEEIKWRAANWSGWRVLAWDDRGTDCKIRLE